jgi:uncharacterized membrane-anchored protein
MSPRARKLLFQLVIALDLLIFGGWIAAEEAARMRGAEVRLPVEGYDPRDLLSGHYVRFRLVAEREASSSPQGTEFCLEERDGRHHVTVVRTRPEDCALFLRARQATLPRFGVERFYIDERRSKEAAIVTAGPDTYLRARVQDGVVHPVDLVVAGRAFAPAR